jgi:hypothetical protein
MLTSLHTKLAAEKHLAEAKVSQVKKIKKIRRGAPEITMKNTSNIHIISHLNKHK